ncbi:hypothetical protein [Saccharothrix obliqua]|uniref:hypothetical protein n=1 Tax=Saccharothrix obliqua TaxID=2861747 RepID=UPI001C5F8342|nr:hypothetical protein [Saccharothrix obliqua]MBW4718544.1 hypothetical protein [Saccharothrix obliqua]
MSAEARLHVRAAVWGRADNRIAVLLLEGHVPFGLERLTATGLTAVADLDRIVLPTARAWRVQVKPGGELTVRWPHRTPLVADAPVPLPDVWRWAARRRGAVLVLLGDALGLVRPEPGPRRAHLLAAAAAGCLAGGAVVFEELPEPAFPAR